MTKSIVESNTSQISLLHSTRLVRSEVLVGWNPPPHNWVKLNTDGAVKGSCFRALAGGIIRNCHGNWLQGFARRIGNCSVLRAELWGIYDGLNLAWTMGYKQVQVEVDNQLCVNSILHPTSLPNDSFALIQEILALFARDWQVTIQHSYREGNRGAYWMAKLADSLELGLHF
ncbi:Ribonuclease H-like superfamily protein [Euphorbia peplus]|nr:Ribonuclease H-like superfamily protein [Euphorbia peplus]